MRSIIHALDALCEDLRACACKDVDACASELSRLADEGRSLGEQAEALARIRWMTVVRESLLAQMDRLGDRRDAEGDRPLADFYRTTYGVVAARIDFYTRQAWTDRQAVPVRA